MLIDPKAAAALALHRFGFGPRPGLIGAIASDPRGAVIAELSKSGVGSIVNPELKTSAEHARTAFDFRAERQAKITLAKREAEQRRDADANEMKLAEPPPVPDAQNPERINFLKEVKARFDAAAGADIGFVERLVWFWSNHFCISADKSLNMAGAYEREAIRPHVLGRFADMLQAVESHPAMLVYLDNATSIGPNSTAGINRSRGLNENLAREIMELHTLGVRSGYTQDDVTRFANVLTGWTFLPIADNPDHGGEFVFNRRLHEPGSQTILGKTYAEAGVEQGRAVLADLARHPATADHIARKLAVHFVADQPPPALVAKLAKTFRDTDGNLKEVSRALVTAEEAWNAPRTKLKRPDEWQLAAFRAVGITQPDVPRMMQTLNLLGQPLWRPVSPKGFADEEGAWIDALAARLDIANVFSVRMVERMNTQTMVDEILGSLASKETRQTVARAESRPQAFALLLMSPEFLRR